jgi:hypothetical protein
MKKGILLLVGAFLLFLASWYFFLWTLSSSSLAFVDCKNTYTLAHENIRCRWPVIASILWQLTGLGSLVLLALGLYVLPKRARVSGG